MKKNNRHEKILNLIQNYDISTQEQLMEKLNEAGFNVTQATVSRDIKAMNLVKTQGSNGQYKYSVVRKETEHGEKYDAILSHAVTSVDYAMNITCVHCYSGMAQAACAAIDAIHFDKSIGTIAGDDTIFILNRTEEAAKQLMNNIKSIIK